MIRLPSAADPEVSVIILLDGSVEMAERCLRAIAAAGDTVPFETVVLLNDPDPELEDLVRSGTTGGRMILSRANAGPGVGWNLGAAVARAPRIATLHEDSEPSPDWLVPLCEVMSETGAGAVGSRLFNADGTVQNCGWVLFSDASHQPLKDATAPEVAAATDPTPADTLSAASMMVDREAVREVGGWDERFHPAVFVDIDVSTSIRNRGRPVLSVPTSRVEHRSGTFDRRPNTPLTGPRLRLFLFERHRRRFLERWAPLVPELAPPPADPRPESVRAAVEVAVSRTRERADRIRSGDWEPLPDLEQAERLHSGAASGPPVLEQDDGFYVVAPEVEQALKSVELDALGDYCQWLAAREGEVFDQLTEAQGALDQRLGEIHDLQAQTSELQRQHQELAATLEGILQSRTWRMRTLARRVMRRRSRG